MNDGAVKETADILKQLTPENQAYFMTLVRAAGAVENGVKNALAGQLPQPPEQSI